MGRWTLKMTSRGGKYGRASLEKGTWLGLAGRGEGGLALYRFWRKRGERPPSDCVKVMGMVFSILIAFPLAEGGGRKKNLGVLRGEPKYFQLPPSRQRGEKKKRGVGSILYGTLKREDSILNKHLANGGGREERERGDHNAYQHSLEKGEKMGVVYCFYLLNSAKKGGGMGARKKSLSWEKKRGKAITGAWKT